MKETFTSKIYSVASQIPKGKVATYKQIAKLAGNSKAYRAVGSAMKRNPDSRIVPCHRVVGSDGKMHGYSAKGGIKTKILKLQKEGVIIKNNKVDLNIFKWER
ncbi:MGMT family protein [Candidatus Dojkabacteria bacterium]|jgi:O-6-methylguanine DNA methyltransferase|nr:MGMT family protein [Candidatus Dojkabacteria bacterium]